MCRSSGCVVHDRPTDELTEEVKPKYIDMPLSGLKALMNKEKASPVLRKLSRNPCLLQDAAAEGAVHTLRKSAKQPALPSFDFRLKQG